MASQTPPAQDHGKQRHQEVLRAADDTLIKVEQGSKELKRRLERALAAYEERRRGA